MPAKYVYGVVPAAGDPPQGDGIDGATLELIREDGLAALVSDVAGSTPRLGREAMTTHARILERALSHGTVLPMRFGVVMPSERAVRDELLTAHGAALRSQLDELAGKVELKLRATYDEESLMREVVSEDGDVRRLRESLRGAPHDATYYGRIRLGELVAAAVERKREADARTIVDALAPLALAVDVAEPKHERIVVSASFLVRREQMPQFDAAVDEVGLRQAGRMRLKYTGPLPPHSFVKLVSEG